MITKIIRNTSLGLIFLAAFIPLYVNNALFFPFITGKAFAFRIIVEIVFALWLILLLRDKRYAPKFSWLSLAVTIFIVVIFITDLLGINPIRSLWSNFERMEGWVMIIHLWAYFIATTSIFGTGEEGRRMWHTFFKVTLAAALVVGLYGFGQLFGWTAIHQGSSRIDASLGNAAYMAVYMLIHSFIAFYMSLVAWEKKKLGFVWVYGILGLIFAFLVYETSTRGTILGLVGGILLALGIFAVFGKGESKKARGFSGGIIAIIILLAVGLVSAKNTSFVKNSPTLNRLASISWDENKTQARGYIWPMAIKGVFESPKTAILGVGQENFNYIFNSHYNPLMWSQEQWFDRAHNVFLDWLVAGGLLGLALYLSFFIIATRLIWKSTIDFKEKALLTGLFIGYAIHNIFVFDNLASYLLFFTMLGFVHSIAPEKPIRIFAKVVPESENGIVVRDYIFVPIIALLFITTLYLVNVRPIQANTRLITAMTLCSGGGNPSSDAFASALSLNQYIANQETREQLLGCAGNVIAGNISPATKEKFYELATLEINNQIKASSLDARGYVIGGTFFNNIGDWKDSLPLLEKANELSPNKQSIIFELAINYMNSGKGKEATTLFQKAYESAQDNEISKIAYISSLILIGQETKAKEIFASTPEILLDQRILNVYLRLKQYQKVIDGYKILVQKNPDNAEYYASLSSAYFESGQKTQALAELEAMKTRFPLQKGEIDAAIAQVKAAKK